MSPERGNTLGQNSKVANLVNKSLEVIDKKYSIDGWTFPDDLNNQEIQRPLFYHNGDHTRMVIQDTSLLAEGLGLSALETNIAILAASKHDIDQDFENGVNEMNSKTNLEEDLSKNGFSRIAVQTGGLAILGTTPRFEGGTIIQKAVEQSYPTKRAELISHIVAGADVGRLFGPLGPLLSHKLFMEFQSKNNKQITIKDLIIYQHSQIDFLEKYSYPSKEIENILSINRAGVIKHIIKLIKEMENGDISRFNQVLEKDIEFINTHK